MLPFARHLQIAGVPDRSEPDHGLPLDPILDLLARANHRDWVGCEYRPVGDTAEGLRWVDRHPLLEREDSCASLRC